MIKYVWLNDKTVIVNGLDSVVIFNWLFQNKLSGTVSFVEISPTIFYWDAGVLDVIAKIEAPPPPTATKTKRGAKK